MRDDRSNRDLLQMRPLLEQVAQKLYAKLEAIVKADSLSGNQIREAVRFSLLDRKRELEALGVSVDD